MKNAHRQCERRHKCAEEAPPHRLDVKSMVHFLYISYADEGLTIRFDFRMGRTSIENSTPPIGEPKATATPAALAAVIISRILPVTKTA